MAAGKGLADQQDLGEGGHLWEDRLGTESQEASGSLTIHQGVD